MYWNRTQRNALGLVACVLLASSALTQNVPYDLAPLLEKASQREAAWQTVEWTVTDADFDAEAGTGKRHVLRVQPGLAWARLEDAEANTVHTLLHDGQTRTESVEILDAGGLVNDPITTREDDPGEPDLSFLSASEYGWVVQGKKLTEAPWDILTAWDLGEVEWNGKTLRHLLVEVRLDANEDLEFPPSIQYWSLDEKDTGLIMRWQAFDSKEAIKKFAPDFPDLSEAARTWRGNEYWPSLSQEVLATGDLNGFAYPSKARMVASGAEFPEQIIQATIPDGDTFAAELVSIGIPDVIGGGTITATGSTWGTTGGS